MALNQTELNILQLFLGVNSPADGHGTHPILTALNITNNYTSIQSFLDSIPALPTLGGLTNLLSIEEVGKYLQITDFSFWLGGVALKLDNNTAVTPTLGKTDTELQSIVKDTVKNITDDNLELPYRPISFQDVTHQLFNRGRKLSLSYGVYCSCADGWMSEATGYRLLVEMNNVKRWVGLGLGELPTTSEISGVLT